jgi:hypothetical protein
VASADTKSLIETAVRRFQDQVPSLQQLKLVIGLELKGRGDTQIYRVEVPGPKVTKDVASDARIRLSIPRADFNGLASEGTIGDWRQAFVLGHAKAEGPPEILQLIERVVGRQEERSRTKKATH